MTDIELKRVIEAHGSALARALPADAVYAIIVSAPNSGMHVYVESDVDPNQMVEYLQEGIETLRAPDKIIGGQ